MELSLSSIAKGLMRGITASVLGFGLAQSVTAAVRTNGPTAREGCVEGDCVTYCQSIGHETGVCPGGGGHCVCG